MPSETAFSIANSTALIGWLVLLATPWNTHWTQLISGRIIPLLLAAGYAALVAVNWSSAEGGFDSLANVARLFATPEMLLAGWVHYLAFDLFIGTWIAADSRKRTIPFLLVIPCLVLTFLFGPAGLLLWFGLRLSRPSLQSN